MYFFFLAEPSSAPNGLTLVSATSKSLTVSWLGLSADDQNGLIIKYTVYYRLAGNSSVRMVAARQEETIVTNSSPAKLTGLTPNSDYFISVSASTSAGEGPVSSEATMKTLEGGKS